MKLAGWRFVFESRDCFKSQYDSVAVL